MGFVIMTNVKIVLIIHPTFHIITRPVYDSCTVEGNDTRDWGRSINIQMLTLLKLTDLSLYVAVGRTDMFCMADFIVSYTGLPSSATFSVQMFWSLVR